MISAMLRCRQIELGRAPRIAHHSPASGAGSAAAEIEWDLSEINAPHGIRVIFQLCRRPLHGMSSCELRLKKPARPKPGGAERKAWHD
jgi:hypothetical protein